MSEPTIYVSYGKPPPHARNGLCVPLQSCDRDCWGRNFLAAVNALTCGGCGAVEPKHLTTWQVEEGTLAYATCAQCKDRPGVARRIERRILRHLKRNGLVV